jgi:winged helix domain-containing protein
MIAHSETDTAERAAYPSNWHYLLEELQRLDCLLHLRLLRAESGQSSAQSNPLRGLALPREEIEELLTGAGTPPPGHPCEDDADIQAASGAFIRLEKRLLERRAASLAAGIDLPVLRLSRLFNLSRFEESCLLLCMAPEIDRKYEKVYAYLQDDVTCKSPSLGLFIDLLCEATEETLAARAAFESAGHLLKYRLLHPLDNRSSVSATARSRSYKLGSASWLK